MKNIVALVTLFNPNSTVIENIQKLSCQVSYVILSDNSPAVNNSNLFKCLENVIYIPNFLNLGLSVAFNKCMNLQVVQKSDFIIFFDQDSSIDEGYINNLVNDFEHIEKNANIGILGPAYFDVNKKMTVTHPENATEIAKGCFYVSEVITSSMLTKYVVLKTVGFWNETVFLDYADFDLCWRVEKAGFKICQTNNVRLNHALGKNAKEMFLPIKNKYVLQSYWIPLRHYYQTREIIKLFWKKYVPRQWRKNFLIHNTVEIFMHLYYLPQKRERFLYFCKGLIDGILRKNGALK